VLNSLQVESSPLFNDLIQAIEDYGTCSKISSDQEKRILKLSRSFDPTLIQEHLAKLTSYTVVVAASYQVREQNSVTSRFDDQVQRYDRLRYLIDTDFEQREGTIRQIKQVDQLLAYLEDSASMPPSISRDTAALCTNTIYGDFSNNDLLDALTANTALNTTRAISLKEIATLSCHNDGGHNAYSIKPLADKSLELSDIFQDIRLTLNDLLQYQSVFDPARYASVLDSTKTASEHNVSDELSQSASHDHDRGINSNEALNRAHESRTESEATSMANTDTVIDAPVTKRSRRAAKTIEANETPAPSEEHAAVEEAATIDNEEQRHLAAMEKESGAPVKGSYLREGEGYDLLSPEQKAVCDKDFQSHLEKRTRPIEQREGESKEGALLRAKYEYCESRQEHTARHGKIAQTMLKSKINCLKTDRLSFSLMNPDVTKEFLATAFYHNAVVTKGLKSFDRETFAKCKNAAQREFAAFASSIETGKAGTKQFNNTFALGIQRPPIGSPSNNLRIAVSPLPGKREQLATIFGKCAFYHSNRSGRTPEEREQRKVARTKQQSDLSR
jgi:hypothetical protein